MMLWPGTNSAPQGGISSPRGDSEYEGTAGNREAELGAMTADLQIQKCQVCGDSSDSHHFGANVCRACAAFFRRTIAGRLRYVCRYDDRCEFSKASRAMCKACRLAKCIRVGMDSSAVRSRQFGDRPDAAAPASSATQESAPISLTPPIPHNLLPRPIPLPLIASQQQNQPPAALAQQQLSLSNYLLQNMDGGMAQKHLLQNGPAQLMSIGEIPATTAGQSALGKKQPLEEILKQKQMGLKSESDGQLQAEPFPQLSRVLLGYKQLEGCRDAKYGRMKEEANGTPMRVFVERQLLDLHAYWQSLHNEIDWVAEMLAHFQSYERISIADKLLLFKNFWILFIILERNYDTNNVLGSVEENDARMVFANGDIYDMNRCQYDLSRIGHKPGYDVNHCPLKPWFKRSVHEVLPLMRSLRPTSQEIAFCFGLMFWRVTDEVHQKLSPEAGALAEESVNALYDELSKFYAKEMPGENTVKRVAELSRLVSITEILALQRKEETILARTFQAFKVDIYMEEIFGRA